LGKSYDAVIVGAGSAGAAAAGNLAQCGLGVALLDRRPLERAGPHWFNGLPARFFDQAGLARPAAPELRGGESALLIEEPEGPRRLLLSPNPLLTVDMARLVARLHDRALRAGATLFDRTRLVGLELSAQRPIACTVAGPDGRRAQLRARLFVDASGMAGAVLRRIPSLDGQCPEPRGDQLCSAEHQLRRVAAPGGAQAFLDRHGAAAGSFLVRNCVQGAYSTACIQVDPGLETVSLLTGTLADGQHGSGPQLMRRLVAAHPWIGRCLHSGGGLIPIRRPYARLSGPGVALLGDAGCQVFPAHASGVGAGLVAARLLSEAVRRSADPGDEGATWAYQRAFQRQLGATHAAYDALRIGVQQLSQEQAARMFSRGLVTVSQSRAAMKQCLPSLDPRTAAPDPRVLLGESGLAAHLTPRLVRMGLAWALCQRHPARPSISRLRTWARRLARIIGDTPDL